MGKRKNKKMNFNHYVWKLRGNADKWNAHDLTLLEENFYHNSFIQLQTSLFLKKYHWDKIV